MSKWKSFLPLAIVILVGFGAGNIAKSLGFRSESMGIGCAIFAAAFFLYKVWAVRPTAKQSQG